MTRINADLLPSTLSDWHLIAEINEIPRVIDVYENRIHKKMQFNNIPKEFTLGKGHVTFFLDKVNFIKDRYSRLISEAKDRGYLIGSPPIEDYCLNMLIFSTVFAKKEHRNYYVFSLKERELVINRIIDRILNSNKLPYYYKKQISRDEAIEKLLTNRKLEGKGQLKLNVKCL